MDLRHEHCDPCDPNKQRNGRHPRSKQALQHYVARPARHTMGAMAT